MIKGQKSVVNDWTLDNYGICCTTSTGSVYLWLSLVWRLPIYRLGLWCYSDFTMVKDKGLMNFPVIARHLPWAGETMLGICLLLLLLLFSSLLFFSSPLLVIFSFQFSSLLYTSLFFSSFLFSSLLFSYLLYTSLFFSFLLFSSVSLLFSSLLFSSLLFSSLLFSSLLFSSLLFSSLLFSSLFSSLLFLFLYSIKVVPISTRKISYHNSSICSSSLSGTMCSLWTWRHTTLSPHPAPSGVTHSMRRSKTWNPNVCLSQTSTCTNSSRGDMATTRQSSSR